MGGREVGRAGGFSLRTPGRGHGGFLWAKCSKRQTWRPPRILLVGLQGGSKAHPAPRALGLPLLPAGTPKLSCICPFPPFVGLRLPAWVAPLLNDMTPKLLDSILGGGPSLPLLTEYTPCHPAQLRHLSQAWLCCGPRHEPVWDRRGWEGTRMGEAEAGTGPGLAGERAAVTNGLCGGRGAGGRRRLIYLGYLCCGRGRRSG